MSVTLPNGCYGLQMESTGQEFNATPGGRVDIPSEYEGELKQSNAVRNGIVRVGRQFSFGTKRGRVCTSCGFHANAWSMICPRSWCGATTREE